MALLATFVGVGKYADSDIRDLVGATRDATALHALFLDTIPGSNPQLLIDYDATVANIRDALNATLGAATEKDTVVFFFSGHGSHDHRLAASDTVLSRLAESSIGMDELAVSFKSTKAKAVLCILDCCFSGGAPAKVLEDSPIPRDPGTPFDDIIGEGRVLLTASRMDEVAYELPQTRHGVLTKALLDMFLSATGEVDVLQVAGDIMRRVQADAARMGVIQTPVLLGNVVGGLLLPQLKPGATFYAAFPELKHAEVSEKIADLLALGFPPSIVDEWTARYPGGLNQLQLDAINRCGIIEGKSLLVIAPTSAGKTFIGEIAAARAITDGKKAIFLLPYKALVNEKYDQFSTLYGAAVGMRVIRCSGDYNDEIGALLKAKYDLALLTYEMFLQIVVGSPFVLNQLGLVVIDETQFITEPSRGINVELLLTFLLAAREKGISPQIIALSAVIGDANNFHQWLGAELLFSTQRPVPLVEGVIDRNGTYQYIDEAGKEGTNQLLRFGEIQVRREKPSAQDLIVPLVRKLVGEGEKVIVFRNARGPAQGCAGYLARDLGLASATDALQRLPDGDNSRASTALRECLKGGTAFHNSNLTREERIVVEQAFRDPKSPLRVLAATTTVAAGINTPASTVILAENEFVGEDGRPFTVADYKNMAGRAGRLGFNEKGKAIIYAETPMERVVLFNRYVRGTLERLQSSFNPAHIETWLVRLLAQVVKIRKSDVPILLLNTYAGYLETRRDPQWRVKMAQQLERLIQRMIDLGLIEIEADTISLSLLGRACGRSSLSFDAAMRLIELIRFLPDHLLNGHNLMGVMQGLPADEMGYTPLLKGTKEAIRVEQATQRFGHEIVRSLQRYASDQLEFYGRCKRAAVLYDWINGRSLEEIEADYSTTPYGGRIEYGDIRRFADTTRFHLQSAAAILAVLLLGKDIQTELDAVLKQLEVGIQTTAIDLLSLPLALTRAEYLALARNGLSNSDRVWAAPKDSLDAILGKARAERLEGYRPEVPAGLSR